MLAEGLNRLIILDRFLPLLSFKIGGVLFIVKNRSKWQRYMELFIVVILVLSLWQWVVAQGYIADYLLPSPMQILNSLMANRNLLWAHSKMTLYEAILGMGLGVGLGMVLAILMAWVPFLDRIIYPLLIISQTIPTVAIAPMLVLWFGYGILPKVLLVILTTFFPITIGLLKGFNSVDEEVIRLMRSMKATKVQMMRFVQFPTALPYFFTNLRLSASYAVVAAVVAEWLGGQSGLGVYMTLARKSYAFDVMFAIIVVVSLLSLVLLKGVDILEYICLPWRKKGKN